MNAAGHLGSLVVRLQCCFRERPPAVGNPGSAFKINVVGRPAKASPVVCRAPEVAKQRRVQRKIGRADILALTDRLSLGIELTPPTLEHAYTHIPASELACLRNPGCSGANDANIRFERGARRNRPRINEHRTCPRNDVQVLELS